MQSIFTSTAFLYKTSQAMLSRHLKQCSQDISRACLQKLTWRWANYILLCCQFWLQTVISEIYTLAPQIKWPTPPAAMTSNAEDSVCARDRWQGLIDVNSNAVGHHETRRLEYLYHVSSMFGAVVSLGPEWPASGHLGLPASDLGPTCVSSRRARSHPAGEDRCRCGLHVPSDGHSHGHAIPLQTHAVARRQATLV